MFVTSLLAVITACGGGGGGGADGSTSTADGDTTITATGVVAESTIIVDPTSEANIISVSPDQAEVVFSGVDATAQGVEAGDMIVTGITEHAPEGMLRKVTAVTTSGNEILLTTEQASLAEALESADISITGTLRPEDLEGTVSVVSGVSVARANPDELAGVLAVNASEYLFKTELKDAVLYDADGNDNTTYDQVIANGKLYFNVKYAFELQVDNFQVKRLLFTVTPKEYSDLNISTNIPTSTISRKKKLTTMRMKPFTVLVGGFPIVVRPIVDLHIGLDGELDVGISTGVSQSASLTGGLLYNEGAWTPVNSHQTTFDYEPPEVSANASVMAYAGPSLTLELYGIVGPYANTEGYLSFNADLAADPWWSLYAGARLGVGVDVTVFGTNLLSHEVADMLNHEVLLAQGEPHTPIIGLAAGGRDKVDISWQSALGATHYNLYWSTSPGVSVSTANRIEDVTSPYSHTGLSSGEDYYYVVTAANALFESAPSAEVSATPVDCHDFSGTHHKYVHYAGSYCPETYMESYFPTDYTLDIEQQGCTITSVNGVDTSIGVPEKQFDIYGEVATNSFSIKLPWETATYPYTYTDSLGNSHSGLMVRELAPDILFWYSHPVSGEEVFFIQEDWEAGEWDAYTGKSVNVYGLYPDGVLDWFPYCYGGVYLHDFPPEG